jgi:quinol monooxygenase YgiN
MFARHQVADYAAFRKGYENAGPMQKAGGVLAEAVYQSADDPTDITVTHEFATMDEAKAFAAKPELKQAMQEAGVVGPPTIWFTNKV